MLRVSLPWSLGDGHNAIQTGAPEVRGDNQEAGMAMRGPLDSG